MDLIEYSTGTSPTGALCEALAHGSANFSFDPQRSAAILWMVPGKALGTVEKIDVTESKRSSNTRDFFLDVAGIKAAYAWSHATKWTERFAWVLATESDFNAIRTWCEYVARNVVLSGTTAGVADSTVLTLALEQPTTQC